MSMAYEVPFAAALLDADRAVPAGLTAHTATVPTRRFAVYRNNVVAGLIDALRARFPAVERIVGGEFFAAMARVFVTERPPGSPLLMKYGDAFPDFIAAFPHTAGLPYLADVARLETARTRAYHAEDATPVDPAAFRAIPPDDVGALQVRLHPSMEIVRSAHPIVSIWAMNSGLAALAPIEDWRGEDALIARPQLDVEVRALPPGGGAFLLALAAGRPLAAASKAAAVDATDFDLTANLAGLFGSGLVVELFPSEPARYCA